MIIDKPGIYKTRDGRKVTVAAIRDNSPPWEGITFPAVGWTDGAGVAESWTSDGRFGLYDSPLDLVGPWPKEIVAYAAITATDVTYYFSEHHQALEWAKSFCGMRIVKLTGIDEGAK